MSTYSISNAINMPTYSVRRFISWRNLDIFARLSRLIAYFDTSAKSAHVPPRSGQIDRCQKNYKETCERNRQNAEKRWGQDQASLKELVL